MKKKLTNEYTYDCTMVKLLIQVIITMETHGKCLGYTFSRISQYETTQGETFCLKYLCPLICLGNT